MKRQSQISQTAVDTWHKGKEKHKYMATSSNSANSLQGQASQVFVETARFSLRLIVFSHTTSEAEE